MPGDPILGYITQGRGVTIHRCDCKNILRQDPGSERLLQVDWGGAGHNTWPVEIRVAAYDRPGLLSDITAVFADARVNLSQAHMDTDRAGHGALVRLSAEVADLDGLSRILGRVARLPNVREVKRLSK